MLRGKRLDGPWGDHVFFWLYLKFSGLMRCQRILCVNLCDWRNGEKRLTAAFQIRALPPGAGRGEADRNHQHMSVRLLLANYGFWDLEISVLTPVNSHVKHVRLYIQKGRPYVGQHALRAPQAAPQCSDGRLQRYFLFLFLQLCHLFLLLLYTLQAETERQRQLF